MSYRVVHAARWTCDECGTSVVGWVDSLPEGWTEVEAPEEARHGLVGMVDMMAWKATHRCPKCVAQATKAGATKD